jgi:hypothetical protein
VNLTEKQISEIAELLDSGLICFFNRRTRSIDYHPDPLDPYFDPEPWQETMDKIEEYWDDYERIDKMDSNSAFQVMEEFVDSINEQKFKDRLYNILSRPKPFANFKSEVETSNIDRNGLTLKKKPTSIG